MLNANITPQQFQSMIADCKELIAILTSITKTAKLNIDKKKMQNATN